MYFEEKVFISSLENRSIVDIAEKHLRLMYLFSQIYILICTQTKFNFHEIWRLLIIRRFAQSILKMAHIYHFKGFNHCFLNRAQVLSYQTKRLLKETGEHIRQEY